MRIPRLALPIAAVLALGAAGCGGDDGPTKAEYIASADAICTDANKQAKTISKQFETLGKKAQEQKSLTPLSPALSEAQKLNAQTNVKFQALDAPKELEDEIAAMNKELDKQDEVTEKLVAAAAKNDQKTYNTLGQQIGESQQKTQQIMSEIGFKVCGQPAQS
jgi:hypothetical protein